MISFSGPEAIITVKKPCELQLTQDKYVNRSFDVVVRRRNYKSFPIQWFDPEGMFIINILNLLWVFYENRK